MNKRLAQIIADEADGQVYEKYSGRGMFGKETTGVVVEDLGKVMSALYSASAHIGELRDEGELDQVEKFRWDSMGLDIIVY
jgi:hypothetical protein